MGRINNSVEIIPIDGPSGLHSRQITRDVQRVNKMSYMSDPFIVQRVRQYLEANVDKTYVDIAEMADYLQNKYKDYSKRKRTAFRGLCKRAYSMVVRSYGAPVAHSSSESDIEDVCDDMDDEKNIMPVTDENELIDISSDDSSEPPEKLPIDHKPASNGPPPSLNPIMVPVVVEKKLATSTPTTERVKKRKIDSGPMSVSKRKKDIPLQQPTLTFKDVGSVNDVLKDICQLLVHVRHPEVYRKIGISPPRGFLLHGPPGCGKTLLASAIAGELRVPLLKVAAPELVAGVSGESEERIRDLFEKAVESAPCVLFIDEIDAITPNRQQAQKEMERRIVAQLLSCLDELGQNENGDRVLVIGATNRPDSLDPALRRAGRFDREVCLGIPNIESRCQILKVLTAKLALTPDFDYMYVAKYSPGFVGADLMALTREAAMAAINRVFADLKNRPPPPPSVQIPVEPVVPLESQTEEPAPKPDEEPTVAAELVVDVVKDTPEPLVNHLPVVLEPQKTTLEELITWLHGQAPLSNEQLENLCIQMEDFQKALKCVQPSAKREGFATVPDVTWDDVGSLQDIREELQLSILAPVRYSEQFTSLGISTPAGVLLCGPPGCGKTLLAKAVANEAGINFISVKGPELLNMYVGESERAVRQCFQRARNSVPCVIFFDELDALCPKRSDSGEGASMRVVNQMLTEMDGVESRQGVFLMAASNRPDIVDPAVLRPGRLDKILYVGLPSAEDRVDILHAITKKGTKPLLAPDVNLNVIGKCEQCDGYTGADLAALVREAGVQAMKEFMVAGAVNPIMVTNEHFQKAITKIRPSVTEKDQKHYEKLRKLYSTVKEAPLPAEEEIMECS
ncbi:smallminded [Carabus blaptoides fortunei]